MPDLEAILKPDQNGKALLYHGSKGGIDGDIAPCSRVRCDFGKGFYMGTNPMQAKSFVVNDDLPYFYELCLDLNMIPTDKIWIIDSNEWLNFVLSCRKNIDEFNRLQISKDILKKSQAYDLIIGKIADDKMRIAMNAFTDNALTDKGLEYCLGYVDLGYQVVAKTENACKAISVLSEKHLTGFDLEQASKFSQKILQESFDVVNKAKRMYSDVGLRLTNIIENNQRTEKIRAIMKNMKNNAPHNVNRTTLKL